MKTKTCRTCCCAVQDDLGDLVCVNPHSMHVADFVRSDDKCELWEVGAAAKVTDKS